MSKLRVFGWLGDHAGCGWYRIMLPLGALNELGLAACEWHADIRTVDIDQVDVLVGQRIFMPGPSVRWQVLAKRTKNRPLLVYELDDDLFNIDHDNPSAPTFTRPEFRENMIDNMEAADLISVSTEPLAKRVTKLVPGKPVAVLPNCIPADLLAWRHGIYNDRIVIGWQGSRTHERDWSVASVGVGRWLRGAAESVGRRVEMHTMGALPSTFPAVPDHRHSPWVRDIPIYYKQFDWDIALAPLAPTVFNRSKSDLRVLEAAMLGIPVIASSTPAYRDSVIHEKTGLLVDRPADWRRALEQLSAEEGLREYLGFQAREWAATRTVEGNAHLWLQAYEKARDG